MRVIDFLDKAAINHPDRAAFIAGAERYTYAQIRAYSGRIAVAIAGTGLADCGRIAVYSPNNIRAFACVLASFRAGGTWVPINARNSLEVNIDFMNLTECEWLFYHSSFAGLIPQIRAEVPTLAHFVCIDIADGDTPALADFIAGTGDRRPVEIAHDPHRMASILGSGGTTGKSKGTLWTNLTWEILLAEASIQMGMSAHPVHLCAAPMTHAAGVLAFMLMPQAPTNIVMEKIDPLALMQNIQEHRVTHLFLPPTALYAMLAHPRVREFDYSSLTHFLVAASPVAPDKLAEAVDVFGPCMCQCYGQVEAPMLVTYLSQAEILDAVRDEAHRHRLMSCGRPGVLSVMEVLDDDDRVLPRGERGEICVRGNLVAPGYYRSPEATAEAHRNAWLHTGDVGYWDADGYVYIVDRKKDMIITGGFNVFSAEVENCINGHPAVENCAVIGVPDPKWGEAVKAIVALKPGAGATEAQIIEFVKQALGGVKAPKSVEFWKELPRTPVGKVQKNEIRKKFWANVARAVN
ncbi:MAG: AMP-binding protein [Gammaproteobacteria bacterium]|nr:AMP-binding protein [Gammaproteobacteria bacterium]